MSSSDSDSDVDVPTASKVTTVFAGTAAVVAVVPRPLDACGCLLSLPRWDGVALSFLQMAMRNVRWKDSCFPVPFWSAAFCL